MTLSGKYQHFRHKVCQLQTNKKERTHLQIDLSRRIDKLATIKVVHKKIINITFQSDPKTAVSRMFCGNLLEHSLHRCVDVHADIYLYHHRYNMQPHSTNAHKCVLCRSPRGSVVCRLIYKCFVN